MIVVSISSVLSGHIDVIHNNDYWCKVETTRTSLFSRQRRTSIYEVLGSDWDSDSRLVGKLLHCPNLDPKVSLEYHTNIVGYLNGWEEDGEGITLEEVFEMMSIRFGDYGEWKLARPDH